MVAETPLVLREGLWRAAIIHFTKCFGRHKSRFQLGSRVCVTDAVSEAAFTYFKSLRDKHVVHDENSYSQALTGAVLNKRTGKKKIATIVCMSMIGVTLTQENYRNLHLLITLALRWVESQCDSLRDIITKEFELKAYDDLLGMESVQYTWPKLEEMDKSRATN